MDTPLQRVVRGLKFDDNASFIEEYFRPSKRQTYAQADLGFIQNRERPHSHSSPLNSSGVLPDDQYQAFLQFVYGGE